MTSELGPIYIWQDMISPHVTGLAVALTEQGCETVYVAEQPISRQRALQGWTPPAIGAVRLESVPTAEAAEALVNAAPSNSIHLCQGIRGNGVIGVAQKALARRHVSQWLMMETVDEDGMQAMLKRAIYSGLFWYWKSSLAGVLAIGWHTADWVVARGMARERVFPFAYFLRDRAPILLSGNNERGPYRFIFAGNLIPRKRVDLLIAAVAGLAHRDVELVVIGSGPIELDLRAQADALIPGRVNWKGRLPMEAVSQELAKADCLVLPSRHDGWGSVVSEALMAGIPAICSDRCGAAEVVAASCVGGVFASGNATELTRVMADIVDRGPLGLDQRRSLALWAEALGAGAGARYLLSILQHVSIAAPRPLPPWTVAS